MKKYENFCQALTSLKEILERHGYAEGEAACFSAKMAAPAADSSSNSEKVSSIPKAFRISSHKRGFFRSPLPEAVRLFFPSRTFSGNFSYRLFSSSAIPRT